MPIWKTHRSVWPTGTTASHSIDAPDVASLVHNYLFMPQMQGDTGPDSKFRLIPTPEDRKIFHLIVEKGLKGIRDEHPKKFYQNTWSKS